MNIALVTIHNALNYGAVLQAFALKKVLSRFGSVEVINYDNRCVSKSADLIRVGMSFHGFLGMCKDIFRFFPRRRVISKFNVFIESGLCLTGRFESLQELVEGLGCYDFYVAGSDQIWNPACISSDLSIDPVYFLKFAPEGAKKISYASSMGAYRFSTCEEKELVQMLDGFVSVSVREKGGSDYLHDLLGREVAHVLDPTLLLEMDEWIEAFECRVDSRERGEYILLYTVPKVSLIRDAVAFVAKKLGLKVVAIDQGLSAGANVDEQIRDAGPNEFVNLFCNAAFVVTDSFHGTCFSLIFEKPFMVVSPGRYSNRIESLLCALSMEKSMVSSKNDFESFDFKVKECKKALSDLRGESINYIKRSLGCGDI